VTETDAVQKALAGEHAAIYGYGVAGAWLRGASRASAQAAYSAHRARRDQLERLLTDQSVEPVAAAASYDLPVVVTDAATAVQLALALEEGVAATYADAVAATSGPLRELSASALQEAAVRAAHWRGHSVPFPGLPERG
jgi:hypothetical protein